MNLFNIIKKMHVPLIATLALICNAEDHDNQRPLKKREVLTVNTENKERNYTIKNEKDGIEDIRVLQKKSDHEESWAYVHNKKIWFELGYNEISRREDDGEYIYPVRSVSNDVEFLRSLAVTNDNIDVLHFHITKEDDDKRNDRKYLPIEREAMLSSNDIIGFVQTYRYVWEVNPKIKFRYKAVSGYGVASVELNEKGQDYFENMPWSQLKKEEEAIRRSFQALCGLYHENEGHKKKYKDTFYHDMLQIIYHPFKHKGLKK